jgi:hypothetical protein
MKFIVTEPRLYLKGMKKSGFKIFPLHVGITAQTKLVVSKFLCIENVGQVFLSSILIGISKSSPMLNPYIRSTLE